MLGDEMTKPTRPPEFQKGDIVRLKTGKKSQKVLQVKWHDRLREYFIVARYLGANLEYDRMLRWRRETDYTIVKRELPLFHGEYEEKPVMPDLYQVKAEPERYGTVLLDGSGSPVKNSSGQLILEMKGEGGKVASFKSNEIELVLPYSVELTLLGVNGRVGKDQSKHVIAEEGQVQKNDVLLELDTGLVWRVTLLDSKARNAKDNKTKWMKIPAEFITFGASDK
jgi:hypothetical protein